MHDHLSYRLENSLRKRQRDHLHRIVHGSYTSAPLACRRLALPRTPGRSAEVFVDGDLEVRFAARPTNGPQVPHPRDELYVVASGTGRYRIEDRVTDVGPGDLLFCAARVAHGFEDISDDFSVWVLFYGPQKPGRTL